MPCLHINIRRATFIVLSVIVNNITMTQMVHNDESTEREVRSTSELSEQFNEPDKTIYCPSTSDCEKLLPTCLKCLDYDCPYGAVVNRTCTFPDFIQCKNGENRTVERQFICRFCYQTESWEHTCDLKTTCKSVDSPQNYYITNCTVNSNVLCLGNRNFNKRVKCNWTGGYRWSTALVLSITLGGFGADRFYLGHWQEGIGKLFSFGGLGVWTIIDVILISLHYLGPADGSLYI